MNTRIKRPLFIDLQETQSLKRQKSTSADLTKYDTLVSLGDCPSPVLPHPTQVHKEEPLNQQNFQQACLRPGFVIGQYKLLEPFADGPDNKAYICIDTVTNQRKLCKALTIEVYEQICKVLQRLRNFCPMSEGEDVIMDRILPSGSKFLRAQITGLKPLVFWISPVTHGDLHSMVRDNKGLSESETHGVFRQIVEICKFCHRRGVLLRDLKLKKFVFANDNRTQLRLESLNALFVSPDAANDNLSDRHGCPAYVSPEVLVPGKPQYAGKASDIWSLGILLFVLIVGRYPFYDVNPAQMFAKIRNHPVLVPEKTVRGTKISTQLVVLIKGLLRKAPAERPTALELLAHPWVTPRRCYGYGFESSSTLGLGLQFEGAQTSGMPKGKSENDQVVPNVDVELCGGAGNDQKSAIIATIGGSRADSRDVQLVPSGNTTP